MINPIFKIEKVVRGADTEMGSEDDGIDETNDLNPSDYYSWNLITGSNLTLPQIKIDQFQQHTLNVY